MELKVFASGKERGINDIEELFSCFCGHCHLWGNNIILDVCGVRVECHFIVFLGNTAY